MLNRHSFVPLTGYLVGQGGRAEEGSFTLTASGFSGTAPSGAAKYIRLGNMVLITLPALSGTSNAVTFTLGTIPAQLRPATAQKSPPIQLTDSGALSIGTLSIGTDGVITLGLGITAAVFAAVLTKGISAVTFPYSLS